MRKSVMALPALCLMLAVAGCYTAPVMPPLGGIYSDYSAPMTTEFNGQEAVPQKEGEATSYSILGLVAWATAACARPPRRQALLGQLLRLPLPQRAGHLPGVHRHSTGQVTGGRP